MKAKRSGRATDNSNCPAYMVGSGKSRGPYLSSDLNGRWRCRYLVPAGLRRAEIRHHL
jgi:hypothetical protein